MAWPSNLVRTKDWTTEILTDADLEGQFDLIITYVDDLIDENTGHKHDGTANEGPQISLNGSTIGVTGELQETDGGTGLSTYTQGDIIHASGADTLSALALGNAKECLRVNSGGTDVEYGNPDDLDIASQAAGDVLYFNGTNWIRLAKGTALQSLQMNSSATAPEWATKTGLSNVIFCWSGVDNYSNNDYGIYVGTDQTPNLDGATGEQYIFLACDNGSAITLLNFKFTKIAGVSTVTIFSRMWRSGNTAVCTVDIGGQSNTVTSTSATPAWASSSTIDVSSLSNGTTYNGVVQLHNTTPGSDSYLSAITLIGS